MSRVKVGPNGIYDVLKKEEFGRLESGADIWKKLQRGRGGEALLNEELISTFEMLMMEGNTRKNAARVVGLSEKTMSAWIKKGASDIQDKDELTLEGRFTWMIHRCEGEQQRMLSRAAYRLALRSDGHNDGTLAVKILERNNPDEWAPALPDTPDAAAQYVGMQAASLKNEVVRVLKTVAKPEELVQPEPAKLKEGNGQDD